MPAVLHVEVSGDVISKRALAEDLAHESESVYTRALILRRAFDNLTVTDIPDFAKIL